MKHINNAIYGFYFAAACLLIAMPSCKKTDEVVTDPPPPVTMTDIDGNVYPTVKIGNQTWTTVNLKTSRYNDGTAIPTGLDSTAWINQTEGAFSIYGDVASNNVTYGKLYNWYAVNTGKLVPAGWHIPTLAEWALLTDYLGTDAGGKMKSTSNVWLSPNAGATNSSGFDALPAGYRRGALTGQSYTKIGAWAAWWTSSEYGTTTSSYIKLDNTTAAQVMAWTGKNYGFPIRCVKD